MRQYKIQYILEFDFKAATSVYINRCRTERLWQVQAETFWRSVWQYCVVS